MGDHVSHANRLADIDVVLASEQEALLLIEIEERPLSPKKLLGDIFAIVLCNRVAVKVNNQNRYFSITPQTELVVAGIVSPKGQQGAKLEETILPRLQHVKVHPGRIPLANVTLVLGDSLPDTIERLKTHLLVFLD